MNLAISLAILAGGVVLFFFGYNVSQSTSSTFSEFFTGSPTDKAMWMIIGGIMATIVGLIGTLRGLLKTRK